MRYVVSLTVLWSMSVECLPQQRCVFVILPNQRSQLHGGVLLEDLGSNMIDDVKGSC